MCPTVSLYEHGISLRIVVRFVDQVAMVVISYRIFDDVKCFLTGMAEVTDQVFGAWSLYAGFRLVDFGHLFKSRDDHQFLSVYGE